MSIEQQQMLDVAAKHIRQQSERITAMEDALRAIRSHCEVQPSALAKAIVATCNSALGDK